MASTSANGSEDTFFRAALIVLGISFALFALRVMARRAHFLLCVRTPHTADDTLDDDVELGAPDAVHAPRAPAPGVSLAVLDLLCPSSRYLPRVSKPGADEESNGCVVCGDADNCAICLDELEASQRVRVLPCGHIFHDNCAALWLCKANRCPVCNSPPVGGADSSDESAHADVDDVDGGSETMARAVRSRIQRRLARVRDTFRRLRTSRQQLVTSS